MDETVERGEVAKMLLWATSRTWVYDQSIQVSSASGIERAPLEVEAVVDIPDEWGDSVTIRWPDVDGASRSCEAEATALSGPHSCEYTLESPTSRAGSVEIVGPGGSTRSASFTLTADPSAASIRLAGRVEAPDGGSEDLILIASRPVQWSLPDGVIASSGDGWSVELLDSDATSARVRVVGVVPTDIGVSGCSNTGCAEYLITPTDSPGATTGSTRTVIAVTGPVDVRLPSGDWVLQQNDPLMGTLYRDKESGDLLPLVEGQEVSWSLRVLPEMWWVSDLAPARLLFASPDGDEWELCITHPKSPESCQGHSVD